MRALIVGLCALCSIGCSDGGPIGQSRTRSLTTNMDGGTQAAPVPDSGTEPDRCDWLRYWGTDIYQDTPCHWSMRSRDTAIALFRSGGGTCLVPATICGEPACVELAEVREKVVVEIWGPPGLDEEVVWSAAEFSTCQ